MPTVAVHSPNWVGRIGALTQVDATTWRATFTLQGSTGLSFEWYAFDTLRDSDASPHGLQIRNLQNQLIFDALRKPQRVVDSFMLPGEQGTTRAYPGGRKYAVAHSGGVWVSSLTSGGGTRGQYDSRIFPGVYCPVLVVENGQRVMKSMRYQCRPAGTPGMYDRKLPGTYNARRDNLEGFWRRQFGYTHGLMVSDRFYENVEGLEGRISG